MIRRRERWCVMGINGAGKSTLQPTNHLDLATKEMLITALSEYEGTMLFVSHDRHFLAALSNRVLELTPEGPHQYGGGYSEYVARTGQEAPGLRS
jgi:ATPase subunit of ABC transporter with duplicated ATPase domains